MRLVCRRLNAPGTWQPFSSPFRSHAQLSRLFTSTSEPKVELAYDLHEPPTTDKKPGSPILILHGLFGSKRNNRAISKVLARDLLRPVYALDLRNHGDSPHATPHNYLSLASDVASFIHQHALAPPTLIGHSMGAKTAMTLALQHPHLIRDLIPVDNAPVDAALHSDFAKYVQGMRRIEDRGVKSQKEADELLRPFCAQLPVRQFLLTNLHKPSGQDVYSWRIPATGTLAKSLDEMAAFPFVNPEEENARFDKPTLFIRGRWSHYVADDVLPIIGRFFPRFEARDVDSGHWVISENPEAFRKVVVEFLQQERVDS